jgi:acyl-CoA carboxylase subunit beta
VADRVLALANAVYSVISPEGCAAIVWKDSSAAPAAARALRLDTAELLRLGVVDAVVPEPPGGAHTDPARAAQLLRDALLVVLDELLHQPAAALVLARQRRFRGFGVPAHPDRPACAGAGSAAAEAVVP